jgi:hypothetical protein
VAEAAPARIAAERIRVPGDGEESEGDTHGSIEPRLQGAAAVALRRRLIG